MLPSLTNGGGEVVTSPFKQCCLWGRPAAPSEPGNARLAWVRSLRADRLSVRPFLVSTYTLKTVGRAVSLVTHTVPEAYLFTVLQGIATSDLDTLTITLLADYYGRQHLRPSYGLRRTRTYGLLILELHCHLSAWAAWTLSVPEGVQRYISPGLQ